MTPALWVCLGFGLGIAWSVAVAYLRSSTKRRSTACEECQLSAFSPVADQRCPCSVIEALKQPDEQDADRAARWARAGGDGAS